LKTRLFIFENRVERIKLKKNKFRRNSRYLPIHFFFEKYSGFFCFKRHKIMPRIPTPIINKITDPQEFQTKIS